MMMNSRFATIVYLAHATRLHTKHPNYMPAVKEECLFRSTWTNNGADLRFFSFQSDTSLSSRDECITNNLEWAQPVKTGDADSFVGIVMYYVLTSRNGSNKMPPSTDANEFAVLRRVFEQWCKHGEASQSMHEKMRFHKFLSRNISKGFQNIEKYFKYASDRTLCSPYRVVSFNCLTIDVATNDLCCTTFATP